MLKKIIILIKSFQDSDRNLIRQKIKQNFIESLKINKIVILL